MNMEKNTYQKSGTSMIFKKEINSRLVSIKN